MVSSSTYARRRKNAPLTTSDEPASPARLAALERPSVRMLLVHPAHLPRALRAHAARTAGLEGARDLVGADLTEEDRIDAALAVGRDVGLEGAADAVGAHGDEVDPELLRRSGVHGVYTRRIGRAHGLPTWIHHRHVPEQTVCPAAQRERQRAAAPARAVPVLSGPRPGEPRDRSRVTLQLHGHRGSGAAADDGDECERADQCAAHGSLTGEGARSNASRRNESLPRERRYDW